MSRLLRIAAFGFGFLSFGIGALLASLVPWPRSVAVAQAAMRRWTRRYVRLLSALGAMRVEYPELPDSLRASPVIAIANHPTLLDVVVLFAWLPPITTVVKFSHFQGLIMGGLLRQCEHVTAPRGETSTDRAATLEQMFGRVEQGRSLLIFPEGTRSPHGGLHPFNRGAFEVARRADVPIVPIVVRARPHVLAKGQPWYDVGDQILTYRIEILDPIVADGRSAGALASDAHRSYVEALGL